MTEAITTILSDIVRTDSIGEAFACVLVHRPTYEKDRTAQWQTELTAALSTSAVSSSADAQEAAIRQILAVASDCSYVRLQLIMQLLERLVRNTTLPARLTCETVIVCDLLRYENEPFWLECLALVLRCVDLVEYKGVREIMKGCCEKAKTLPAHIPTGRHKAAKALTALAEKIMDRDASLLPGYLLVNELQKAYPDDCPHWTLAAAFSDYVASFRQCAQMVSVIGLSHMRPIVEHSGCAEHMVSPWRLDAGTLRFTLKGTLPYKSELMAKQTGLLRYVLEQPYSRDMVCGILGLQKQHKQHCAALEEQLVELVVLAMERSEQEGQDSQGIWLHLSSQLIYFVLFQFASFKNIVLALHSRLQGRDLKKGRDQLMWVLLQFISGSIQRNPLSNFLPVLKLYELLFPDDEPPLTVPDYNHPQCTRQMAMTCIWIHLTKKAQSEGQSAWTVPNRLRAHHEFLQHLVPPLAMGQDYRIALLCNAYSTNSDYFNKPMAALVETIQGNVKSSAQPTAPLSMAVLDSLTVHSKMSLIHSIVAHVINQSKSGFSLAPALVETYSRLLVYTEIESLGIKGFITHLLPAVYKTHAWNTLYTLLEMFSYRMHHIHPHYRVQLLSHLHSLAAVPQANQTQLHLCVESTALRLITGLGSAEVQPELSRFLQDPKQIISAESEELNRALVLTLARATHITGSDGTWCTELLVTIQQNTSHAWAPHTLECFPRALADFFAQNPVPKENKQQLKKAVEEEYRKWASMTNEADILSHFGVGGAAPLFLCLLWKMLLETDQISPIAYKILERIGARALSAHLRKFCDCLVFEFSNSPGGPHVNKCVDTINDMIWKYNIVTIDRLVLCLALRTQEGSEAQVCSFIIQLILLKATEFRNRVQDFVKDNSPDHWRQTGWHERHLDFHRKHPEKFAPEEQSGGYHPYFGNVCLRFLPVFDIVVHRFLEITQVTKSLEILLEHLGCLYKFHDRPVTYLYNTLHYYEAKLQDRPPLKRKLVAAVLGNLKDTLSEPYQKYLTREEVWNPELDYYIQLVRRVVQVLRGDVLKPSASSPGSPAGGTQSSSGGTPSAGNTPNPHSSGGGSTPGVGCGAANCTAGSVCGNSACGTSGIVASGNTGGGGGVAQASAGNTGGSVCAGGSGDGSETDWRFNEFPNAGAQVLYSSCVELMALSAGPKIVANALLNVILHGFNSIPTTTPGRTGVAGLPGCSDEIHHWLNAIGLLLSSLPVSYWSVLHDRLIDTIKSLETTDDNDLDMFRLLDFGNVHKGRLRNRYAYMLALAHSVWHHAGPGHIASVPRWVRERLPAIITNESQFIFVCHLIGPFLARFSVVSDLTVALYELLAQVDREQKQLKYIDPICDLLYHIKYMFVGDSIKKELETIVRNFQPALQMRLRFIAHLPIEEVPQAQQPATTT